MSISRGPDGVQIWVRVIPWGRGAGGAVGRKKDICGILMMRNGDDIVKSLFNGNEMER